ncbi:hypothetical protein FDECE_2478 [Fusarium decemcellulare]|nr:hypothetical protein FDECE_2478 [Fusarium decemcellulare]
MRANATPEGQSRQCPRGQSRQSSKLAEWHDAARLPPKTGASMPPLALVDQPERHLTDFAAAYRFPRGAGCRGSPLDRFVIGRLGPQLSQHVDKRLFPAGKRLPAIPLCLLIPGTGQAGRALPLPCFELRICSCPGHVNSPSHTVGAKPLVPFSGSLFVSASVAQPAMTNLPVIAGRHRQWQITADRPVQPLMASTPMIRMPLVAGLIFWGLGAVTILFELIGIIFTAYESGGVSRKQGAIVTATGLAFQAAALLACTGLHFWFTLGVSTRRGSLDARHSQVYSSSKFKQFLMAMEIAAVLLIVYSIYRLVEFSGGVSDNLFQNEAAFMVIGGVLPLFAGALLTVFHPGTAFAEAWDPTSPRGIKRQSRPGPIQSPTPSGHPVHHLYEPDIRKQLSPTSQKQQRSSVGPPELPAGSMGLPSNPKPTSKPSSPQYATAPRKGPPAPLNLSNIKATRESLRAEQRAQPAKNLVQSEELW